MLYAERGRYAAYRLWQVATLVFPILFVLALVLNWALERPPSTTLADDLFFLDLMSIPLVIRLGAAELVRAEMNLALPLRVEESTVRFPHLWLGLVLRDCGFRFDRIEGFAISPPLADTPRRHQVHRLYLVDKTGAVIARYYPPRDDILEMLRDTITQLRAVGFQVAEGLPSVGLETLRAKVIPRVNPIVVVAAFWPGIVVQLVSVFLILQSNIRLGGPVSLAGLLLFLFPGIFALREWRAAVAMTKSSRAAALSGHGRR